MRKKDFSDLVKSVKEAGAIRRGEKKPSRAFFYPETDIVLLRKKLGATQLEFATMMHVSVGTLRNWEQGRRSPTGPAIALLTLVAANPSQARKVLAS